MDIHREGEFYVWEDLEKHPLLGIDSRQLDACLQEVNRRKVYGVFGNPTFGFKEVNLDFLKQMKGIKSVWFWDVDLKDISGLYEVTDLISFGVHPKRPTIDFSRLPGLQKLVWHHKAKDTGISTLEAATDIDVWHYKPSHKSYKSLELPPNIVNLGLYWANPASLADLPTLPRLKKLELHRCRNLESLDGLTEAAPNLEQLLVITSGTVTVPADLRKRLPKLKRAWINNEELI